MSLAKDYAFFVLLRFETLAFVYVDLTWLVRHRL